MTFVVSTEGRDRLMLRKLAEDFASHQWIPTHYTTEQ